jgi:hypothetical protein
MNISTSNPRECFFVPSIKSQSLLGKAIQEHFTNPEEVASVFSSSPSLQNSSVGANFLTNFVIDKQSAKLFSNVFTPEDCYSCQFAPRLNLTSILFFTLDENSWTSVFNCIKNLITKTKYLDASLRSLKISSRHINNEQLQFILSNLKRITKIEFYQCEKITSDGWIVLENLSDLKELSFSICTGIDDRLVAHLQSKLNRLEKIDLFGCDNLHDDSVGVICKIDSLTSLSLCSFWERAPPSSYFKHLASLENLRFLSISNTNFSDADLEQISSHQLPLLQSLNLSRNSRFTNDGLKFLSSFRNLELLNLDSMYFIGSDEVQHIWALKNLTNLALANTNINDEQIENISRLERLMTLDISSCEKVSDKSLENLKQLNQLTRLNISFCYNLTLPAIFSFVAAGRTSSLKEIERVGYSDTCSGFCAVATNFLKNPPTTFLDLSHQKLLDEELPFLFSLLAEKEKCDKIQEISLKGCSQLSCASLVTIDNKFKNLRRIDLEGCDKMKKKAAQNFLAKLANNNI